MFRLEEGGGGGSTSAVTFELYKVHRSCCDDCKKPCRWCCIVGASLVGAVTLKSGDGEFKFLSEGEYLVVNKVDGTFAGYERKIVVTEKSVTKLGTLSVDNGTINRGRMLDRLPPVP